jgi:hypothetical protein
MDKNTFEYVKGKIDAGKQRRPIGSLKNSVSHAKCSAI